jgi:hypothetical protein
MVLVPMSLSLWLSRCCRTGICSISVCGGAQAQFLHLDPPFPLRRIARKHMQQLHLSKPRIDRRGPCDAAAEVPLDGIGCQHSMTDARGCHVPWICNGETSTSPKRLSREKLVRRKIGRWLLRAHFTSGLLNNLVERTLAGRDTIRNCREKEAEPSPCLAVVPQYGECGFTSLQKMERVDRSVQLGGCGMQTNGPSTSCSRGPRERPGALTYLGMYLCRPLSRGAMLMRPTLQYIICVRVSVN